MRLAAPSSFCRKAVRTSPAMTKLWERNDFFLALDRFHRHRRVLPDLAQRHAARADDELRHRRRDPCAVPVRVSVRIAVFDRGFAGDRRAAAASVLELLAMGDRRRGCANRRDRADAHGHGAALLRRHHRLHQDRTDSGRDLRADLSRRRRDAADDDGDLGGDGGRADHVVQARRHGGRHQADAHRLGLGRHVRFVGDRLSRRDSRPPHGRISSWRRPSRWWSAW